MMICRVSMATKVTVCQTFNNDLTQKCSTVNHNLKYYSKNKSKHSQDDSEELQSNDGAVKTAMVM